MGKKRFYRGANVFFFFVQVFEEISSEQQLVLFDGFLGFSKIIRDENGQQSCLHCLICSKSAKTCKNPGLLL